MKKIALILLILLLSTGDQEPVTVHGTANLSSFAAESFVVLEDQAGFVTRDRSFTIPLESQVLGPISDDPPEAPRFTLSLPAAPLGTFVDVDHDGEADTGVQVFAVTLHTNVFTDPFLDQREGQGWSTTLSSVRLDPEDENKVIGGIYLVWSPNGEQAFPEGFGPDGLLFTADDQIRPIPEGWNLVDVSREPFRIWKEAEPHLTLYERGKPLRDYSAMGYTEAFNAFFEKASQEYPFTAMKAIDWEAHYQAFYPRIQAAERDDDPEAFNIAMRDFLWSIPDGNIGFTFSNDLTRRLRLDFSGSLGMVLGQTDAGDVIVTYATPGGLADLAGIEPGATIVSFDGVPIDAAIEAVTPWFGPFSAEHTRRLHQMAELVRLQAGAQVTVTYIDRDGPDEALQSVTLFAATEWESWDRSLISYGVDPWALPVEFDVLDSGLGYIKVQSFSDDKELAVRVFERALRTLEANDMPGLILDLRHNYGGETSMAAALAGYFIDESVPVADDPAGRVLPAGWQYGGAVAVLVGPDCHNACEYFAHILKVTGAADMVVGMYPTNGALSDVSYYLLPAGFSLQWPTGRLVDMDGEVIIEGRGVEPTLWVERTPHTLIVPDGVDVVRDRAESALLEQIRHGR